MEPQPLILEPESFREFLSAGPVMFCGDGSEKFCTLLREANCGELPENAVFVPDVKPVAVDMMALSELAWSRREFLDLAYSTPWYRKDFQATKPKNKGLS